MTEQPISSSTTYTLVSNTGTSFSELSINNTTYRERIPEGYYFDELLINWEDANFFEWDGLTVFTELSIPSTTFIEIT